MSQPIGVVIDNGSGNMKAGFSGADAPCVVMPQIVGVPKQEAVMQGLNMKDVLVGHEAQNKRGILKLKHPVENGIVNDFEGLEHLVRHTLYHEMRVDPTEINALVTEAPLNPKSNRERMGQLFLETLNTRGFYISIQAVLGLYAAGRVTGVVADSGDGVTHTAPIYEGFLVRIAVKKTPIAGSAITQYMRTLCAGLGYELTTSAEFEVVRVLKEKHCYVALDPKEERDRFEENPSAFDTIAELPDGTKINLANATFEAPEALFCPSLLHKEAYGVTEILGLAIKDTDLDLKRDMFSNILLTGGTTMTTGFPERVLKEISAMAPPEVKVKILNCAQRNFSVWIGGSILTSLNTFANQWVTRDEYDEFGPSILHRKCSS